MTHSAAIREADAEGVLRAMLAEVGERMLLQQHLTEDSPALAQALTDDLEHLQ